jgi:DNA recombination protein RmuC
MSYLHATIPCMESIAWVIACLLCAIAGFVLSYLWSRSQVSSAREQWLRAGVQAAELEREAATLRSQLLELAQRSAAFEERARMMGDTKQALENAFKSLSADALKDNNAAFLNLAKASLGEFQQVAKGDLEKRQQAIDALVGPVKESLEKVDQKIHALERVREQAYGEIRQQFTHMAEAQTQLRQETANLVKALRQPHVRGRWGEVQLRRVVEMAGMLNHCDFTEQETLFDDDGKMLRPDMVVRLPGGRTIVVDAKAPISAYLDAHEANDDEVRRAKIREHAQLVRMHLQALSKKSYWEQFDSTPECVVMFIPGEAFCSAALEADPELLDNAFRPERDHRVARIVDGAAQGGCIRLAPGEHRGQRARHQPAGPGAAQAHRRCREQDGEARARTRERNRVHTTRPSVPSRAGCRSPRAGSGSWAPPRRTRTSSSCVRSRAACGACNRRATSTE